MQVTEVIGALPYASNATLLARTAEGDLVVYKPEQGERPLWDFPWRTLAAREAATWEVSEAMALPIVPETRLAVGPYGRGSAQRFIDEDLDFDPRPLLHPRLDPCLWPFAVLDLVCNNADRKVGHIIRELGTGRLYGIDHGLTFHVEDKLRTVLWGYAGEPLPVHLVGAVELLDRTLDESLEGRLAELLSDREAVALRARVRALLGRPLHPEPPLDRPVLPWPVW